MTASEPTGVAVVSAVADFLATSVLCPKLRCRMSAERCANRHRLAKEGESGWPSPEANAARMDGCQTAATSASRGGNAPRTSGRM